VTDDPGKPPFYARVLRLRHIRPGVVSCFIFLEGALVLSGLLALTDLVSPWVVLVLPAAVAAAVKINDVVAGATARGKPGGRQSSRGGPPGRSRSEHSRPDESRSERSRSTRPRSERSGSTGSLGTSEAAHARKLTSRDLLSEKLAADKDLDR
jgi:hypothetical protein